MVGERGESWRYGVIRWTCPPSSRQAVARLSVWMARPVRGGQPEENDGDGKRERVRRLPTLRLVNGAGNCGEASQDGGSRRPGTASPSRTVKVRPGTQHAPPASQDASRRRTQPGGPELASSHPDHTPLSHMTV